MSLVLITTDCLVPGDEVDLLLHEAGHQTVHRPMTGKRDPEDLVRALEGVDAALIANEPMSAAVLAQAESLRVIVRTGVGFDSVDTSAAADRGIAVSNLPGINANAVAEYTMGLLLCGARRLYESASGVAKGDWPRHDGHELAGSTLGLVGYGATARAVVPLARAFGMQVLCTTSVPPQDRVAASVEPVSVEFVSVEFVSFEELLARSDYVSIHTSLTDKSRGLFDASTLARMKPSAVLINTARGAIVDENALADAVRSGVIAGAALDVVIEEPLPEDNLLRDVPGIVVYSHLAGQTAQARRAAGLAGAAEIIVSLKGDPLHCVNLPIEPSEQSSQATSRSERLNP